MPEVLGFDVFDETRMLRISHSQVGSYDTCQKLYELSHVDNLQSKQKSDPLEKGSAGHKVLEIWAQELFKNGKTSEEALSAGILAGMEYNMALAMQVIPMITHWVTEVFPRLGWKILEIEKTYYLPVGEANDGRTIVFPYTVDLLVEISGYLVIVDHKFTQDAYDEDLITMLPQLKKYIGASRALGMNVHHGMYNFFRTRDNMKNIPERLVRREDRATGPQIVAAMGTQINKMKIIANHEGEYFRTMGSQSCKRCPMLKICIAETSGRDSSAIREHFYEPNEYGYSK